MSTKKYVSLNKLSIFLDNLKNVFSPKTHGHTLSEIEDLIIDKEVAASENLVQNSAVNSAIESTKDELREEMVGKNTTGETFTINGTEVTAGEHAEIFNNYAENIATGKYSHAEGYQTIAKSSYSHAEGYGTEANSMYQHVRGKYNVVDSENLYSTIIGNGSSENDRKNIHTLDWDGNAWYSGEIRIGGSGFEDTESKRIATTDDIAALVNSAPETLDTLGELATAMQENEEVVNVLNEAIGSKANKADIVQADWNQNDDAALDYVKNRTHWIEDDGETYHPLDERFIPDTIATKDYVEALYKTLNSNTVLGFYCIEDVTIVTNGVSKVYPANSNVEVKFIEGDTFEIIPTSDNSILALNAFPGVLGTYYPWLEGVKQFSNILFDMNDVDFYSKWSQGNQGAYQVQFAQYSNCIFWSDNPYISEVTKRTNYTLYYTSQLPLCYSAIPDNTFKAFYMAMNVNSDPNWGNKAYRDSFAKATWATQAFSYYGARTIGVPGIDDPSFNIVLPKDCRGLMFYSPAIENVSTFDAINTTNFGAKSGSWREAFGYCTSLRQLYIKNLKVNLNISWSPINYNSISFIISEAANTNAITISVSPYTYYLLSQADFDLAASKNIVIELLTTNYVEDKRLSDIANKADKTDVQSLEEKVGDGFEDVTDEEIMALFN